MQPKLYYGKLGLSDYLQSFIPILFGYGKYAAIVVDVFSWSLLLPQLVSPKDKEFEEFLRVWMRCILRIDGKLLCEICFVLFRQFLLHARSKFYSALQKLKHAHWALSVWVRLFGLGAWDVVFNVFLLLCSLIIFSTRKIVERNIFVMQIFSRKLAQWQAFIVSLTKENYICGVYNSWME